MSQFKEEIIKKRLLNEEKNIKKLTSTILQILKYRPNSEEKLESKNKVEGLYQTLAEDFSCFEYEMMKNNIKLQNISKDHKYYINEFNTIQLSADKTTHKIDELTKELKIISKKKNLKVKYNQISSHVVKLQPQVEMKETISLRKREYHEIKENYEDKVSELDGKQKKLEFVLSSLKNFLIEEENGKA